MSGKHIILGTQTKSSSRAGNSFFNTTDNNFTIEMIEDYKSQEVIPSSEFKIKNSNSILVKDKSTNTEIDYLPDHTLGRVPDYKPVLKLNRIEIRLISTGTSVEIQRNLDTDQTYPKPLELDYEMVRTDGITTDLKQIPVSDIEWIKVYSTVRSDNGYYTYSKNNFPQVITTTSAFSIATSQSGAFYTAVAMLNAAKISTTQRPTSGNINTVGNVQFFPADLPELANYSTLHDVLMEIFTVSGISIALVSHTTSTNKRLGVSNSYSIVVEGLTDLDAGSGSSVTMPYELDLSGLVGPLAVEDVPVFSDLSNNVITPVNASGMNFTVLDPLDNYANTAVLNLSGSNHFTVSDPSNPNKLDLSSGAFKIELEIYTVAEPNLYNQVIFDKDGLANVSTPSYALFLNDRKPIFWFGNGTTADFGSTTWLASPTEIIGGAWNSIVVEKDDAGVVSLKLNNVIVNSTNIPSTIVNGNGNLFIGLENGQNSNHNFVGLIRNFKINK